MSESFVSFVTKHAQALQEQLFFLVDWLPNWIQYTPFLSIVVLAFASLVGSFDRFLSSLQHFFYVPIRRGIGRALVAFAPIGVLAVLLYAVLFIPGQSVALSRLLFHSFYPGRLQSGFRPDYLQTTGWACVNFLFALVCWQFYCVALAPVLWRVKRDLRRYRVGAKQRRYWLERAELVGLNLGVAACTVVWTVLGLLPFATERNVNLVDFASVAVLLIIFASLAAASFSRRPVRALVLSSICLLVSAYAGSLSSVLLSVAVVLFALLPFSYERFITKHTTICSVISPLLACACGGVILFVQSLTLRVPTQTPAPAGMFWVTIALWLWPTLFGVGLLKASVAVRKSHFARVLSRHQVILWSLRALPTLALACLIIFEGVHARLVALTVPMAISGVALILLSFTRFRYVRYLYVMVGIAALVLSVRTLDGLSPRLDLGAGETLGGMCRAKDRTLFDRRPLDTVVTNWTATRKNQDPNAPVIIIAAAGGGIRAAAHVADSLAAADEATQGRFGDSVFAISAVSGGSLGAALWEASLKDGIAKTGVSTGVPLWDAVERIAPFFSHDFVSPVASRLMAWDLPWSMMPGVKRADSRDGVLVDLWADAYAQLRRAAHKDSSHNPFTENLSDLNSAAAHLPLLLLNSSSASDGRIAVSSSAGGMFPGAHLLDDKKPLAAAVLDSARFPVVSAVGVACSDDQVVSPKLTLSYDPCGSRGLPIEVADGGYIDNSGSVTLAYVIDELIKGKVDINRIYVVYISSNPEADLPAVEGKRFSSGTAIGNILAAGSIFEQTRVERANLATDELAKRLPEGHLVRWSLSSRILFDIIRDQGPLAETEDVKRKRVENQLLSTPLGWTLDDDAAADVARASLHHAAWLASKNCGLGEASDRGLCAALNQ